ncbi:MAG: DUF4236 domain-containing protein [Acidobacteriota bacterium]|nr:DUF4236 domain-containing protein [Acidobacteriota bacterium]
MGWRFRQSFTIVPGLRLNLSKSGLSASMGEAPFTFNVGPHGLTGTASLPGTGLSYRHHFPSTPAGSNDAGLPTLLPAPSVIHPSTFINTAPIEEVHSASTELLTSATLKQLKQLIESAERQRHEITADLDSARTAKVEAEFKYESWENGFLCKRLFKKSFAKRKDNFETETAKVAELEEQQKLSTISTHIELEREQAELYYRFRDEFAALCECAAIWDIKSHQATDKFHERTTASTKINRELVRFDLGSCDLIQWDQKVPHLRNAKGGEMYLYPGFILYRAAREAFSLIEYHDITGKATNISFQEEERVPSDTVTIGSTWAKANKDGSRDKRFADNYQIPIVRYGELDLRSKTGLWEEFHFSNLDRMVKWLNALNAFTSSFEAIGDADTQPRHPAPLPV